MKSLQGTKKGQKNLLGVGKADVGGLNKNANDTNGEGVGEGGERTQ